MAELAIIITGLRELQDYFSRNAPDAIKDAVDKSLTDLQNEIQNTTTSLCPVDTGALLQSIQVTNTADSITATAGMDYASYVDEGTRFMSAQPFFTDPINNIVSRFDQDLESAIDEALRKAEP